MAKLTETEIKKIITESAKVYLLRKNTEITRNFLAMKTLICMPPF